MTNFRPSSGLEPRIIEETDEVLKLKTKNNNRGILILTGLGILLLAGYGIASLVIGERTLECAHEDGQSRCTYELAEVDPLHVWVRENRDRFSVDEISNTRASDETVSINFKPDADVPSTYHSRHSTSPQLNISFYNKSHEVRSRLNAFVNNPTGHTVDVAQGWTNRPSIVAVTAFGLVVGLLFLGFATAGYSVRVARRDGTLRLRQTKFFVPKTTTYDAGDITGVEIERNVGENMTTYRPILRLRDNTTIPIQHSYEPELEPVEKLRDRINEMLAPDDTATAHDDTPRRHGDDL